MLLQKQEQLGLKVEDYEKLINQEDVYGNTMGNDGSKAVAIIVQNQTEDVIRENHSEFYNEFKILEEKLAKGEKLTEDEQKKYNLGIKIFSGETFGVANSNVLVDEVIEKLLGDINKDIYDTSVYKDVLEQIKTLAEDSNLLNKSKDEIVNVLNKATNGNYSIIANGEDKPLNAPAEVKVPTEAENADLGLPNAESVDTSRLQVLTEQVASTQEVEPSIVVEKTNKQAKASEEDQAVSTYQQRAHFFRTGDILAYKSQTGESSFTIAKDILVNIGDACQKAQDFATTYLENASFTMQKFLLNGISQSQEAMKVAAKTIDLSNFNLNLSVTTKKAVEKIQEQCL